MIQWLKAVIGQVLGITQPVLPVIHDMGILTGGVNNIAQQPHQPAKRGRKPKAKVVSQTTQDPSTSQDTSPAQTRTKKSSTSGSKQVTPASKTRQPASQVKKPKRKVAVSTTQVKKRTPSKTCVQTRTARKSKANGS